MKGIAVSKCPKCENSFVHVNIKEIKGKIGGKQWNCISYNCPHCETSLGIQMDPIALMTDTVTRIKRM
jgi:uncharacterized protein with PIN domain